MNFFYILIACFLLTAGLLTAGCGKNEANIEKEKIQKEADELKKKVDTTQQKIIQERKNIDSIRKNVDRHTPDKTGGDAVTQPGIETPGTQEQISK